VSGDLDATIARVEPPTSHVARGSGRAPITAFYAVADERYFLGAVGMLNSLRLAGHDEPVHILDCGLEAGQRRRLETQATLIDAPQGVAPWLLKTVAPLAHPADVMVLIDADMLVTRSLAEPIERAAAGGVVAFANDTDRFVASWGEELDLGPARRGTYVSSGLVFLGGAEGAEVLRLLDDRQRRVDIERTFYGTDEPGYPFRYPEQDVLNAILATSVEPERLTVLPNRLAPIPPFDGVKLGDGAAAYDDRTSPYVLHHLARKPWLEPVPRSVYSRLLARVLLDPGAAIPVEESELPRTMRSGAAGGLARGLRDVRDRAGLAARRLLPSAAATRLDEHRNRRAARRS
jgi:hypothetical protein